MDLCQGNSLSILVVVLMLSSTATSFCERQQEKELVGMLSDAQLDSIDQFIEGVLACRNIPGVSLSIVTRDRVVLERGYGFADIESGTRASPATLFPIASNTKAFTATILAILLRNSTLTWDTPIKGILGADFELYDDILTEQTSLRDLLAHKTGVPDYFLPLMAVFPEGETRKNLVRSLRYHKPIYPFRTKFRYNNYMYMLAGYVAEVLGGASWEDLVRTHILEPLGMDSTTFITELQNWDALATPYVELDNGDQRRVDKVLIRQADVAGPAGAVLSTAEDISRWLQMHLCCGVSRQGMRVVTSDTLADTYMEQMPSPTPMAERDLLKPTYPIEDVHLAYDMGWMTNIYRGFKRIWHSGGVVTYKSQAWFYPELGLGLFIVCNGPPKTSTTWALINILQYLTDVVTKQTPWINSSTVCTFPYPWKISNQQSATPVADNTLPSNFKDFVGTFHHPGFGDINITYSNSMNRLRLHMGRYLEAILLYNKTSDVFHTNFTGKYWYSPYRIPVTFKRSLPRGEIDVLYMPLNSPWADVEPFPFARGHARQLHKLHGSHRIICTSIATNTAPLTPISLIIAHAVLAISCWMSQP